MSTSNTLHMVGLVDINECEEGDHECTHICINTVGSYNCSCRPGFYLTGSNKHDCTG